MRLRGRVRVRIRVRVRVRVPRAHPARAARVVGRVVQAVGPRRARLPQPPP